MATAKDFDGLAVMIGDAFNYRWVLGLSGNTGRLDMLENAEGALVFRTHNPSEVLEVLWNESSFTRTLAESGHCRVAVVAVCENGNKAWRILTQKKYRNTCDYFNIEAAKLNSRMREYMASRRFQALKAVIEEFNKANYEYKAAS